ncbi:hypothetical protein GH714_032357 [Hevea brasiliensis]|uniref:Uncharacterized protein n=1 Tax=Hevea brasiliensis TaxID=3981 RepID=A0A6A6LET9_HEVBR|nr:hypothetical protein GH714_032357 [Hevea brasiliensis]
MGSPLANARSAQVPGHTATSRAAIHDRCDDISAGVSSARAWATTAIRANSRHLCGRCSRLTWGRGRRRSLRDVQGSRAPGGRWLCAALSEGLSTIDSLGNHRRGLGFSNNCKRGAHGRPGSAPARGKGVEGDSCVTPRQTCPRPDGFWPQLAFKDSMIHEILQFTPSIAFCCVLHRCESRDICCQELFRFSKEDDTSRIGARSFSFHVPWRFLSQGWLLGPRRARPHPAYFPGLSGQHPYNV